MRSIHSRPGGGLRRPRGERQGAAEPGGLRPDGDLVSLVIASAPRGVAGSEAGPSPARSFCAYCHCAAEASAPIAGRDGEFLRVADYFLEVVPRWPWHKRQRVERALRERLAGGEAA